MQKQETCTAAGVSCQLSLLGAPADAARPEVPECIAARNRLQQTIAALDLPANFLDELVNQLGGPGMGSQGFVGALQPTVINHITPALFVWPDA